MTVFEYGDVRRLLAVALLAAATGCSGTNCVKDTAVTTSDTATTSQTTTGTTTTTGETAGDNDVTINVSWGEFRGTEAVGTLWIAVYSALPDALPGEITEEPFLVTSVDIDQADAVSGTLLATHVFEAVPVTTDLYYLTTFLDTNGDAGLPVPTAGTGDVWARGGVDGYPGFSAAAKGAEANIMLSFLLP